MRIKKITKMKSGKYRIDFDDHTKLVTHDNIIIENNILFKKEIDHALYDKLYNETLDYNLYNRVLKYTLIKMRSLKEIKKYMNKLEITEEEQTKIISRLRENDFINDAKFTEAFIADKINLSNMGPNKIKRELLEHDINIDIIEEFLSKYGEDVFIEKVDKLISKKTIHPKNSNYMLKQKITNYLLDLGYELNMIQDRLNRVDLSSNIALEKDYNKLVKKLSLKYSDSELIRQIKNKLYQKGYQVDEINVFLENREL